MQYNNLLNPAQPGDSIHIYISTPLYYLPGEPYSFGGGAFLDFSSYNDHNYPYPSFIDIPSKKTNAGKNVLKIYKKKMGIITQTIDTIKIYPYETKTIEINW